MFRRRTRNLAARRPAIGAAFAIVTALHALSATAQGVAQHIGSFSDPIHAAAPTGDARLFVAERGGTIRVIESEATLATPFLDITDRVSNPPGLEGGFLGLVFAPDYAQTGVFYVYYTSDIDPSPAITFESRVSRFTVSPPSSNVADPQETVLFRLAQPYFNHNGGTIAIRDGFLYLGLGDGGSIEGGDPAERAQDDQSLFGKMLRFDLAQQQLPWTPVVWAKGFRNPFRFSFDRDTGDLYVGDVGENAREEIDVERADSAGGLNYGWDVLEGTNCFADGPADPGEPACDDPLLVPPVHEYAHGFPSPCAVTGGVVYRGSASPSLSGLYFFSDFCGHQISTFRWNRTTAVAEELTNRTLEFPPSSGDPIQQPVAITEDGHGELILVSLHGEVYRLVPEPESGMLATAAVATLASLARRRRRRAKQDRVAR